MAEGRASSCNNANPAISNSTPAAPSDTALSPLDFMLALMRDPDASTADKKWAAEKAAPYLHPRLQTVEHGGAVTLRHEDALKDLV